MADMRGKRFAVGSRVRITRLESVRWLRAGNLSITGTIRRIDPEHREGFSVRPIGIEFDDRPGIWWYERKEIAHA